MKKNLYLVLIAMVSSSLLAQTATNAPSAPLETPAAAPAITNTPPAKVEKKKSAKTAKKKSAPRKEVVVPLRTVPLVAGPASVVASNVNVRGQAKLKSEVIGKLNKGENVTVLEEITLKNSGREEPSAWAKITLPASVHVWVNAGFIDANKAVVPAKLKLRGGPGENYSVLGMLKKGDAVKQVSTKGEWLEIEPPADAFAFVAAQYLKQEPAGSTPAIAAVPVEPTPVPTAVTDAPPVVVASNEPPTTVASTGVEPAPAVPTNAPPETEIAPVVEEPPPKRIVQREGLVRGTFSIQAPTKFELISPDNRRPINYLYTSSTDLDLSRYKGLHIIVTGEEGLDERWRNTPVITIQKIQVLE